MNQTPLNRSRSDKFILVLDLPKAMKRKVDLTLEDNFRISPLQLSIFGSPVPSINIPAIDVPYGGHIYKTSSFSRPAYDPLTLKFLIDNGFKNYWVIWNWMNLLNDFKTSEATPHTVDENHSEIKHPMSDYTSTFTIFGMDEFNNNIISFKYTNAFPTQLSEINFSNQEPNEIISTVTFAFNTLEVKLERDVNRVSC